MTDGFGNIFERSLDGDAQKNIENPVVKRQRRRRGRLKKRLLRSQKMS